jgi:hypothetical protein
MSTMRAGSTLLTALLANASDTSYLPEINFNKIKSLEEMNKLSKKKIVILKKPSWYSELDYYPKPPELTSYKVIILARDVYSVIKSLEKMHQIADPFPDIVWNNQKKLVDDYWCKTYENILNKFPPQRDNILLVRYEDLIENPKVETKKLFSFIGSKRTKGVDRYSKPKEFEWKWGIGDASPNIKQLKVLNNRVYYEDIKLLKIVKSSDRVQKVRKELGYTTF